MWGQPRGGSSPLSRTQLAGRSFYPGLTRVLAPHSYWRVSVTGTSGVMHGPSRFPTILIFPVMRPPRKRSLARNLCDLPPALKLIAPARVIRTRGRTFIWTGPIAPPSSQVYCEIQALALTTLPDLIVNVTDGAAVEAPAQVPEGEIAAIAKRTATEFMVSEASLRGNALRYMECQLASRPPTSSRGVPRKLFP